MTVPPTLRRLLRQVATTVALTSLAASAVYGGDFFGVRTKLIGSEAAIRGQGAVSRDASGGATPDDGAADLRSQPWWRSVATFTGDGDSTTRPFLINRDALQWRVTWSCVAGRIVVKAAGEPEPFVDQWCPAGDPGYSTRTGATRLQVVATGRWELEVEQQVDVPLVEPPLGEMTAPGTARLATGWFYDVDKRGRGSVTLFRFPDGRNALRLDDFFVTPNVDLEIRFSPAGSPVTTESFLAAPSALVAPLDVTAGFMNVAVPPSIDPGAYRSVVIWCPPLRTAYAAASLVVEG